MIIEQASIASIERKACEQGMRTLRADGLLRGGPGTHHARRSAPGGHVSPTTSASRAEWSRRLARALVAGGFVSEPVVGHLPRPGDREQHPAQRGPRSSASPELGDVVLNTLGQLARMRVVDLEVEPPVGEIAPAPAAHDGPRAPGHPAARVGEPGRDRVRRAARARRRRGPGRDPRSRDRAGAGQPADGRPDGPAGRGARRERRTAPEPQARSWSARDRRTRRSFEQPPRAAADDGRSRLGTHRIDRPAGAHRSAPTPRSARCRPHPPTAADARRCRRRATGRPVPPPPPPTQPVPPPATGPRHRPPTCRRLPPPPPPMRRLRRPTESSDATRPAVARRHPRGLGVVPPSPGERRRVPAPHRRPAALRRQHRRLGPPPDVQPGPDRAAARRVAADGRRRAARRRDAPGDDLRHPSRRPCGSASRPSTSSTPRTRSPVSGGSGSTSRCSGARVAVALRPIPHDIPEFDDLGLPESVKSFTDLRRGLVLVTGPTGSGKSTSLASLIDIINRTKPLHIVTVEDPIEFLHTPQAVGDQPARGRAPTRRRSQRPCAGCCARTPT